MPSREVNVKKVKVPRNPTKPTKDFCPSEFFFDLKEANGKPAYTNVRTIKKILLQRGFRDDDPRLKDFFQKLEAHPGDTVDKAYFMECLASAKTLFDRIAAGDLVIPHFEHFTKALIPIYEEVKHLNQGAVADYIPQLKKIDPNKFGISVCTTDGQRFSIGDAKEHFSIQSCSKPLSYLLALEEHGEDVVHKHVGREPSGHSFNEITLDPRKRPHNPMINAGAIMSASLVQAKLSPAERFDYVLNTWKRCTGGGTPHFNNAVYLSEKQTADRNCALAYFMNEHNSFPENTDLLNTLDFYIQCCSVELDADSFAVAAATLARSGLCPLTGERIFDSENVKNCLSLMHSSGMYDFSGEFAFLVGLPAKSGVGGGLLLVIPNVMGICIWSPPLDKNGNSVRGIEVCKWLVEIFNFHHYSNLNLAECTKIDPRLRKNQKFFDLTMALCMAGSQGDLFEMQQLLSQGAQINQGDYDHRTAMHLAASHGHLEAVKFLLRNGATLEPKDCWGGTPLDDATRNGHADMVAFLTEQKTS